MKKLPQVMKRALDACRTAQDALAVAEAAVDQAGKKRDRAIRNVEKRLERIEIAFEKSGGVVVVINDLFFDAQTASRKSFISRVVYGRSDKSVQLDGASKSAEKLHTVYDRYIETEPSPRCATVFAALVKQLCALEVLSADDRLVAIDGRYFVKDDKGKWFGVMKLSFEEV